MPASPVPVLFSGPSLVQLARQYGASIIALLDETSGTSIKDYSGNNNTITAPSYGISYGNRSVARTVARGIAYLAGGGGPIYGPTLAAGSFTAIQFMNMSSSVSNTYNYPQAIACGSNVAYGTNQGFEVQIDTTSTAAPWNMYYTIGYSATAQASTLWTQIAASAVFPANKNCVIVATYNASNLAMSLYLRKAGDPNVAVVASGTAGGAMTAGTFAITFGDGFMDPNTWAPLTNSTGPGLYFQKALTQQQINSLTAFVQ